VSVLKENYIQEFVSLLRAHSVICYGGDEVKQMVHFQNIEMCNLFFLSNASFKKKEIYKSQNLSKVLFLGFHGLLEEKFGSCCQIRRAVV